MTNVSIFHRAIYLDRTIEQLENNIIVVNMLKQHGSNLQNSLKYPKKDAISSKQNNKDTAYFANLSNVDILCRNL